MKEAPNEELREIGAVEIYHAPYVRLTTKTNSKEPTIATHTNVSECESSRLTALWAPEDSSHVF